MSNQKLLIAKRLIIVFVFVSTMLMNLNLTFAKAEKNNEAQVINGLDQVYSFTEILYIPIGDKEGELGIKTNRPEELAVGPSSIIASEEGVFVIDTVNNRIMSIDLPNRTLNSLITYSSQNWVIDFVETNNNYYLLDKRSDKILKYDDSSNFIAANNIEGLSNLSNLELEESGRLSVTGFSTSQSSAISISASQQSPIQQNTVSIDLETDPNISSSEYSQELKTGVATSLGTFSVYLQNAEGNQGEATIQNESFEISLSILSPENTDLAGISLIDRDNEGNFYLLVDSFEPSDVEIKINSIIAKYDISGNLITVIDIYDNNFTFPEQGIAVSPEGDIYQIITDTLGTHIFGWFEQNLENPVLPVFADKNDLISNSITDNFFDYSLDDVVGPQATITRDQVIANATAFAEYIWTVSQSNYSARTCSNSCPVGPSHWIAGTTVQGVAYQWGGYDSISDFTSKLSQGYLAGDVSGTSCVGNCATGVDCSGFVSQAWQTSRYTTDTLPNISTEINVSELKAGDIFNKAGSHVVLFYHFDTGGNPVFYESQWTEARVILNHTQVDGGM